MRILNGLLLILTILTLPSCDDMENDNFIQNKIAPVTSIDAPVSGNVDEEITIEVNFQVTDGCGQFGMFLEEVNGNTTTIEVEARYEGPGCTLALEIRTAEYKFVKSTPGEYELRFKSGDTENIVANITID